MIAGIISQRKPREVNPVQKEEYLRQGEYIAFYTGGLIEARNENGDICGKKRLLNNLAYTTPSSAKEVLNNIKGNLNRYVKKNSYNDDITCLILKHR